MERNYPNSVFSQLKTPGGIYRHQGKGGPGSKP